MIQLKVWTGVKKTSVLEKVFNPALSGTGLPHVFVQGDELPICAQGELLYALGDDNVKKLKAAGVVPKNFGIGKLREKVYPYGLGHAMVSWNPNLMEVDPSREPEVQWDARLAARFLKTGTLDPVIGAYEYVTDFNKAFADIKTAIAVGSPPIAVSLDLETIGFSPFAAKGEDFPGARIVSVAVTVNAGTAYVYRVPSSGMPPEGVLDQIRTLTSSPKVKLVGANLKFDNVWLIVQWGIEIKNHKFDTFLVGSLLNENIGNSLNMHAKMHTDMGGYDDGFNSKYDKGRMDLVLETSPAEFLTYAGGDTDAALRVMVVQRNRLMNDPLLSNFYTQLVQPVSNAFARIEQRGVVVDVKRYDELKIEVTAKLKELETQALAMIPYKLRIKYKDNLSLSRPVLLKDFLFTPNGMNLKPMMYTEKAEESAKKKGKEKVGWEEASTSMDHLIYFQDNPEVAPFIAVMKEWGSAKKTLSTYIEGFMKHLQTADSIRRTISGTATMVVRTRGAAARRTPLTRPSPSTRSGRSRCGRCMCRRLVMRS